MGLSTLSLFNTIKLYLVLMLLKLEHNKCKSNQICKEEDRTYNTIQTIHHHTTKPLGYKYLISLISNISNVEKW